MAVGHVPFWADLLRRGAQEDVIQPQLSKRSGMAGKRAGMVNDRNVLAGGRAEDVALEGRKPGREFRSG
jgi:hypothetical protein